MSKKRGTGEPKDVPGNVLASVQGQQRWLQGIGQGWVHAVDALQRLAGHGIYVTGMSFRYDWETGGETLLVIRADSDEGKVVSFHGTTELYGLWQSLANRIDNGTLKWREDEYGRG